MRAVFTVFLLLLSTLSFADELIEKMEATTTGGDKVILHPNGRWEFVDSKKAIEAAAVMKQQPDEQTCPPGSRPGLFGLGRCIHVGDKDYSRGSLSGKGW